MLTEHTSIDVSLAKNITQDNFYSGSDGLKPTQSSLHPHTHCPPALHRRRESEDPSDWSATNWTMQHGTLQNNQTFNQEVDVGIVFPLNNRVYEPW